MFQYAASKTLADRKGFRFCFRHRSRLKGKKSGPLRTCFELDGESMCYLLWQRLVYALTPGKKHRRHRNREKQYTCKVSSEIYDERFYQLEDGETVQGGFQSEKYFRHNRERVLSWFTPQRRYLDKINALDQQIDVPADKRCCVHIRHADYHAMQLRGDGLGWNLPVAYYKQAMRRLPDDLFYVVVSDSPELAARIFEQVPNKMILTGQAAVVDMFMFTRCKYNIIANSTFSWWGAWLNQMPDHVVIGPKYNLGWPEKIWLPDEYAVAGWDYVDVLEALEDCGEIDKL